MVVLAALLSASPALAKRTKPRFKLGGWVSVTLSRPTLGSWLARMPPVRFSSAPTYSRTLNVNPSATYQSILGFGAAMTDSSAWLLYDELAPGRRAAVMRALFSSATGIGLNFIRVPMGASDFTATGVPYTYDDLPAGQTDPRLTRFSIAHDESYIVPALREMLATNHQIHVLASEWSPPAWMKSNSSLNNIGGAGTLRPGDFPTLALYFAKFIFDYQQAGIPVWAITPQNEPDAWAAYPAMTFTPQTEGQFVSQNLMPLLAAAGLHTKVFGLDSANLPFAQSLMQTSAVSELAGIAWHCYQGPGLMNTFHDQYPAVENLVSECSPGIIPYGAGEAAIDSTRNWASAVNLWNLALDDSGGPVQPPDSGCLSCTGLLSVSEATHQVTYNPNYYELGQFSKFVQTGAVRIDTERWVSDYTAKNPRGHLTFGVTRGLDNVAFRNPDGTYVMVCHNNGGPPVTFGVAMGSMRFKYRLGGWATVTFKWKSAE